MIAGCLAGGIKLDIGNPVYLAEFADGLCRHANARLRLDPHMTWQATKRGVTQTMPGRGIENLAGRQNGRQRKKQRASANPAGSKQ